MVNKLLVFSILIITCSFATAQRLYKINGLVMESKDTVPGASVMVLDSYDSTLLQYVNATNSGKFEITEVPNGKYLLQINSAGVINFYKRIEVNGADLELGAIDISSGTSKLNEVEIKDLIIPIRINGDTVEYNADAFKTKPNAVAEDLLKKLPGVEVDKDGNIKAQGEQVNKVLVDGKEFFGDDAKMATKNIPAEAIDKVQVYDKKSENAEQTGIDDGEHEKTINLTLKKNKKNGIFGNIEAAYAHEDKYYGKLKLFKWGEKTQLTFLGLANNMNESGFSWNDYADFMGGWQNLFGDENGFDFGNVGIPIGGWDQDKGVASSYSGALNVNHNFTKRTKLSFNYSANRSIQILHSETNRKYSNIDNPYSTYETQDGDNRDFAHRGGFKFDIGLDSTSEIKTKGNFSFLTQDNLNIGSQTTYGSAGEIKNMAYTDNVSDAYALRASGSAQYRKKFSKKGRNLSFGGDISINPYSADTRLYSLKDFTQDTIPHWRTDTLHQQQIAEQEQLAYSANFSYSEPITEFSQLQLQYKYSNSEREQVKDFYDIPSLGEKAKNDSLSGTYRNQYSWHNASLGWSIRKDKHFLLVGVAGQVSDLRGKVAISDTLITKQFRNVLPRFRYTYKISKGSRINANYNTSINAPSIAQLQPVVDNSNPLQLYVGNPDLKAEYNQRAGLQWSGFSGFNYTSWFLSGSVGYTSNKISTSVTTDKNFIQTSRPVNVDYEINYDAYAYYEFPIKPLKIKLDVGGGYEGSQSQVFVNGELDDVTRMRPNFEFNLENRVKENFDLSMGMEYGINSSRYSRNSNLNQTFYTYAPSMYLEVYLGEDWTLSSEFDWTFYRGNAFNKNQDIALWDVFVSYQFLKGNAAEIKLRVFDVLNQYRGFEQNTSVNYIEEVKYNTLSRFFMIEFKYSLKRMG